MTWKIIRNNQNEITKYQLTNDIYIEREYAKSFTNSSYFLTLIVDGNSVKSTGNGSGYTLKDLKDLGEKYYNKKLGK